MHFQWGKRTCPRRPGKRKYYGLFNISHTSRCTSPQAAFSVCLPAFHIALLQNHFANPSTCQVTAAGRRWRRGCCCCYWTSPGAVCRRFSQSSFISRNFAWNAKRARVAKVEKEAKIFGVRELIADRLITNLSLRFSLLKETRKKLEHHQSICDTAWHDIVYFICYTLLTKLVCVNLLQFEGALKETRPRNLLKAKAINNLLLPTFRRLWQTFKQSGVFYMQSPGPPYVMRGAGYEYIIMLIEQGFDWQIPKA